MTCKYHQCWKCSIASTTYHRHALYVDHWPAPSAGVGSSRFADSRLPLDHSGECGEGYTPLLRQFTSICTYANANK